MLTRVGFLEISEHQSGKVCYVHCRRFVSAHLTTSVVWCELIWKNYFTLKLQKKTTPCPKLKWIEEDFCFPKHGGGVVRWRCWNSGVRQKRNLPQCMSQNVKSVQTKRRHLLRLIVRNLQKPFLINEKQY